MANDASLVLVGRPKVSGAIFSAPLGSTLPTDASASLNVAFVGLGYASEDGVEANYERTSEEIREWGGRIVKNPQTDVTDSYGVTLIQSGSVAVLKEVYGASNVTETGGVVTVSANGDPLPSKSYVFDMVDGSKLRRVVIPNGQITAQESSSFQRGAAVAYPITITAYPDTAGNTHYEYLTGAGS